MQKGRSEALCVPMCIVNPLGISCFFLLSLPDGIELLVSKFLSDLQPSLFISYLLFRFAKNYQNTSNTKICKDITQRSEKEKIREAWVLFGGFLSSPQTTCICCLIAKFRCRMGGGRGGRKACNKRNTEMPSKILLRLN